jgi:hypothetical protein
MFSRLIGSTSSPFRNARLRALYRKQYLTPTIILREIVSEVELIPLMAAYHKFVNTTPKPNATKKSKGELVGPLDELELLDIVVSGKREEVADRVCEAEVAMAWAVGVWVPSRCISDRATT